MATPRLSGATKGASVSSQFSCRVIHNGYSAGANSDRLQEQGYKLALNTFVANNSIKNPYMNPATVNIRKPATLSNKIPMEMDNVTIKPTRAPCNR
jgi:hypothetical protein